MNKLRSFLDCLRLASLNLIQVLFEGRPAVNTQVRVAICRVGCLVLAGAFMPVFLFRNPFAPAPARAQNATATRSFHDLIPKHLPIKIKLKTEKEKDFLDIKNPQWLRNFVLEVRNTGHKPIYFFPSYCTCQM